MRRAGLLRIGREATHGREAGATARTILGTHKGCPYDGNMNHLGQAQGFKPRIARIARIILGQHDETDDTDFASGCALAPPGGFSLINVNLN